MSAGDSRGAPPAGPRPPTDPVQQVVESGYTVPEAAIIERELTAAWRAAATDSVAGGGTPVARTSTGTVVALVGPDRSLAEVRDTVLDATATQPSRILLVRLDPESPEHLEAQYSVFCQMPASGRRHVCNEIIQFDAGGAGVHHIPPLILGLLEPNLPVTVWATERAQWESPGMATVFHVADRLVVDSEDHASLAALRAWQKGRARFGARRVAVVDMAWQRIHAWRLICAELFDGLVERGDLEGVSRVDILLPPPDLAAHPAQGGVFDAPHAPEAAPPRPGASALLLGVWLAGRLGWRVTGACAPATVRLSRTPDSPGAGPAAVAGAAGSPDAVPGEVEIAYGIAELLSCPPGWHLHSVSLSSRAPRAAAYTVRVHPGGSAVIAAVSVADACAVPQSVPTRALPMAELLGQALSPCSSDRMYDEALARAVDIAAALDLP